MNQPLPGFPRAVDGGPFFPPAAPVGGLAVAAGPPDLLDRLPALYREGSGAFLPLLEAAAGTVEQLSAPFRAGARALRWGGAMGGDPARDLSGTTRGLREFLSRDGAAPEIRCGMVVETGRGEKELEMVRSEVPSVVLLWPSGTERALIDPARIPEPLVPLGVKVIAVALEGPPPLDGISGERFRGEIIP